MGGSVTGIVRGIEIKKNRDGNNKTLMLNCEISGPKDIQSVEYMANPYDNYIPEIGSTVIIIPLTKSWKIAIANYNGQDFDSTLNPGERKLSAPGNSYIQLNDDDTIELNGSADFAAAFNDLKAGFDQLVSDFNIHVHVETGASTAPPTTPSTASIDAAKVDEVLLP